MLMSRPTIRLCSLLNANGCINHDIVVVVVVPCSELFIRLSTSIQDLVKVFISRGNRTRIFLIVRRLLNPLDKSAYFKSDVCS